MKDHLGGAVTVVGADAGLHVVVWLNDVSRAQESAVIARAYEAGLGLYPVTPSYVSETQTDRPGSAGLVMGYAGLDEHAIERGVQMLRQVLSSFREAEI